MVLSGLINGKHDKECDIDLESKWVTKTTTWNPKIGYDVILGRKYVFIVVYCGLKLI